MSTMQLKVISKPPPPPPCTIAELTSYHPFPPPPPFKPITMVLLITTPVLQHLPSPRLGIIIHSCIALIQNFDSQ